MEASMNSQATSEEVTALQRVVFERTTLLADKTAALELGMRYIEGRSVEPDLPLGCALLNLAGASARDHPYDQLTIDIVERLQALHCVLPPALRSAVGRITACGYLDHERRILQLDSISWLEFTRMGILLNRPSGPTFRPELWCGKKIVLIKKAEIDVSPESSERERAFVQVLAWESRRTESEQRRALVWTLLEIAGSAIEHVVSAKLMEEPGSLWPTPTLPSQYQFGALLTGTSMDAILWRFPGDDPARGTIHPRRK
jgi:hypothetical protein